MGVTCVVIWDKGSTDLLNSFLNAGLLRPQHIINILTICNICNPI